MSGRMSKSGPERIRSSGWRKTEAIQIVAFCLFLIGFGAPLIGLVLFVADYIFEARTFLGTVGSASVLISIPILMAASHLMDIADRRKN